MLTIEAAGRTIAFTGDTGWTEALFRMAGGADLLIAECSTWDRPLANHLDYRTLRARREELRCSRLLLTHLGADVIARTRGRGPGDRDRPRRDGGRGLAGPAGRYAIEPAPAAVQVAGVQPVG
jgi:hypothetical protein